MTAQPKYNTFRSDWCYGNWGTLLLPINEDDSIDFKRLSDEIGALIAAGVDGIYSNGTAGRVPYTNRGGVRSDQRTVGGKMPEGECEVPDRGIAFSVRGYIGPH